MPFFKEWAEKSNSYLKFNYVYTAKHRVLTKKKPVATVYSDLFEEQRWIVKDLVVKAEFIWSAIRTEPRGYQ